MKVNYKNLLKYLIILVTSYFIINTLAKSWSDVPAWHEINYLYLGFAIFFFALQPAIKAYAWFKMMLYANSESIEAGKVEVDITQQIKIYYESYMMRYIPGNVVGILGRGYMNQEHDIKMVKSLWGWVLENFLEVLIGGLLGSFIISQVLDLQELQILSYLGLIAGVVVLVKFEWVEALFLKVFKMKFAQKLDGEIEVMGLNLAQRFEIAFYILAGWIFYSISFLFTVASLYGEVILDHNLIIINAFAWSAGYLSIVTPSGTGVREYFMIEGLIRSGGIVSAISGIITIVARLVNVLGELVSYVSYKLLINQIEN